jgi:hypothetical protein
MPIQTAPWLEIAILPTSWKLRVLTQMLDMLDPVTAPVRRQRVEDVHAQVRATWEMELLWRTVREAPARPTRPPVKPLDGKVDLYLGSIFDVASRIARAEQDSSALGQAARDLLARFFPRGAGAVTQLPFEEELAVAQSLDAALHGELAQDVAALGLTYWATKLRETLPDYEAAIDTNDLRPMTFAELQRARAADHESLCRLVIYLLQHALQHPADAKENSALLQLYTDNAARLASLRRSRGQGTPDVDPNSGEVSDAP